MSKISVKITEVDQKRKSIVVKFASEQSLKPLDEYDGLAFGIANFASVTPKEFIESIKPQLSKLVAVRDQAEKTIESLDLSDWLDYTTTIEGVDVYSVEPAVSQQIVTGLANPEVIL